MPNVDGVTFLEAVRGHRPKLPVLLFSGEEPDNVAAETVRAGLTDCPQKGFGTDQYTMLVRRVEHAVEGEGTFDPEVETEADGVGILRADERFEEADETYASLYGYAADEARGRHWTELHPHDEVEHIRTHILPVVEGGGEWHGRSRGLRSDGSLFTESKLVTALADDRLLIAASELRESDSNGVG